MTTGKQSGREPLWIQPLPVIGLTGEYNSGKSLFPLTICDPADILVYDFEKSSATYEPQLGFKRIDVSDVMQASHTKGYKPIQVYEWWRDHMRALEPGKWRVIVVDPASELESGCTDWVRANPNYFGKTLAQYQKMAGIMWGDMKELWKMLLADLSSRCETFVFTVHMGEVWSGEKPTGKRKPRGKSTLMELASLFLWLERNPDGKGNVPIQPSARVLKHRLLHTRKLDNGTLEIVPALPPRLPVATPDAIRAYMRTPPDYGKLKAGERAPEVKMSDDDLAAMRLQTAEAEKDRAALELEKLQREEAAAERAELRAAQRAAQEATQRQAQEVAATHARAETTPNGAASHNKTEGGTPPRTPEVRQRGYYEQFKPERATVTQSQLERMLVLRAGLFEAMGILKDTEKCSQAWAMVMAKRAVNSAKELSERQAEELIDSMSNQLIAHQIGTEGRAEATPKSGG